MVILEPWSEYKITFYEENNINNKILDYLFNKGYFLDTSYHFTYNPFSNHKSNDMEISYIGYKENQSTCISYISSEYYNKINNILDEYEITVDILENAFLDKNDKVILKRGIIFDKIACRISIYQNVTITLRRISKNNPIKICRLDLIKILEKGEWVDYNKSEEYFKLKKKQWDFLD